MADKKIEQMLEHLVNDDVTKAEELFHEYVVAKSREIYESLIMCTQIHIITRKVQT